MYPVYGTFKVTTEGDCEGKSIKDLGTYQGYIDEIAFALADKCFYTLTFTLQNNKHLNLTPKKNTVNIRLDVDSGIWGYTKKNAKNYFKELFKDREVIVLDTHGNGSCTIRTDKETIRDKKLKILEKLTDEEKEILGLADLDYSKSYAEIYNCVDDDVYCKCRSCKQNKANGGTCSHCIACISGEKAMDKCEEYLEC